MTEEQERESLWNMIFLATLRLAEKDGYKLDSTSFMYSPIQKKKKLTIDEIKKEFPIDKDVGEDKYLVPVAAGVGFNHQMFDSLKNVLKVDDHPLRSKSNSEHQDNKELFNYAKNLVGNVKEEGE